MAARAAAVVVGGVVSSHKGVNLPGVALPIPSLTPKDRSDLELALELEVDYVALSFVRKAADVRELRQLIEQAGSHAEVIAKIEKAEAVDVLDEILAETDAIMVARGDLGVEIGPASVPLLQKRIILRSLELGKPVITATQMLESMIEHAEPTRAEASDVANAVLDGSSALMLSGETAVGAYPVEAVAYMDRIARAVEPSLGYRHQMPDPGEEPTVGRAMSNAACDLAEALGARGDPRSDGDRADRLRRRPPAAAAPDRRPDAQPLRAPADGARVGRDPAARPRGGGRRRSSGTGCDRRRPRRRASSTQGDRMVITAGTSVNIPGTTNLIKRRHRLEDSRGRGRRRNRGRCFAPGDAAGSHAGSRSASSCCSGSCTTGPSMRISTRKRSLRARTAEVSDLARAQEASSRSGWRRSAAARRSCAAPGGSGSSSRASASSSCAASPSGGARTAGTDLASRRWTTAPSSRGRSAASLAPSGVSSFAVRSACPPSPSRRRTTRTATRSRPRTG